MTDPALDPSFILACQTPIDLMRNAGLSDVQIATIISTVRSVTLSEEHRRLQTLIENHPPYHHPWPVIKNALTTERVAADANAPPPSIAFDDLEPHPDDTSPMTIDRAFTLAGLVALRVRDATVPEHRPVCNEIAAGITNLARAWR